MVPAAWRTALTLTGATTSGTTGNTKSHVLMSCLGIRRGGEQLWIFFDDVITEEAWFVFEHWLYVSIWEGGVLNWLIDSTHNPHQNVVVNLASRIIHGVLFLDFPFYKVLQVTAMWYLSLLHQPRVPIRSFSWCVLYIPADSHWFQSHVIPAKVARIQNYVEHSTNSWCWLPSN